MEDLFVSKNSIVRQIWGKSDTVLFIFAGAAAEFALNKAVDWLYFTGRLPADPLGRLFSTVGYARSIIFSDKRKAFEAIDKINAIHQAVEKGRNARIPDWAYRDVLFLLIDYSIRSYEVLERKLTDKEKNEVFDVFLRVGARMEIKDLPATFDEWLVMREDHLAVDLVKSHFTDDLYQQYRKHLGAVRYAVMLQVQALLTPGRVSMMLGLKKRFWVPVLIWFYKLSRYIKLNTILKEALLPAAYKTQIKGIDIVK